jgi:hypothetical protein
VLAATLLACVALATAQLAGQTSTAPTSTAVKSIPRTPDGHPDLQGTWNFATATPLQRPKEFAGKEVLTAEEAAKLEERAVRDQFKDQPPPPGDPGAYNRFWFDSGTKVVGTHRTSLIVDPPDGKLPAFTPEAQERQKARTATSLLAHNPEDLGPWDRCILGFNAGPPIIPYVYNNMMELYQTHDQVVILTEMVHDARVVPLDGRPHLPPHLRHWRGDSRGHWEGDTLVIDTTHFRVEGTGTLALSTPGVPGPVDENLHLVERFARLGPDTLQYSFTVDDRTVWTRPWTALVTMTKTKEHLYEYACHEGNYGMTGILSAARAGEKTATDAPKKTEK